MCVKTKTGLFLLLFLWAIFSLSPAMAEIKVFEQEIEEAVSRGQSQEQVEAFALQKAKRLAVEEAGTYISSLTMVKNYQLQKDEVTALASGIVQAKVVGIPAVRIDNGVVHVKVKARIDVDTGILDRQIQEIMKEKGTLKKLEEERKKNRELEEKIANLKSTEVKRLEELNAQALAVERERERQRLFREEQALKAKGELSRAEAERISREREMQARISRTLAEQEKAKREEAAGLAAEQDRIRRASLENEQRMNDLSRRAKLSQESWLIIDDSLSLKQAMEEVKGLKAEIANLMNRLDFQYQANTANLHNAYSQQRSLITAKLPPQPAPKDAFETTAEYNNRIAAYKRQVKEAEEAKEDAIEKLQKEETLKLTEAKVEYLDRQVRVLTPFIERLNVLQTRKFTLPEGGALTVKLDVPDADNKRFPVNLQYNGKSWSTWWGYADRNSAKDFYNARAHLKAEGLFQLEETANLHPKLTAARVTHLATRETREFALEKPATFREIVQFERSKQQEASAERSLKKAAFLLTHKEIGNDGRFIAYDDGTVLDTRTNLMWAAKDNGYNINWHNGRSYCENYRGGGYMDWRMPTQAELAWLYDKSRKSREFKSGYHIRVTELIHLSDQYLWASEMRGSDAAYLGFGRGNRGWRNASRNNDLNDHIRVLPVRSNETAPESPNENDMLKGLWKTKRGSVNKSDGKEFYCVTPAADIPGWLNQLSVKNIRKVGNKWLAEHAWRNGRTGKLDRWKEVELSVDGKYMNLTYPNSPSHNTIWERAD